MTTPVCQVCPGPGGGYAVGECGSCGRPGCEEHFVGSANQIPVRVYSGPQAEWRRRSQAYQGGWAAALAQCTACREKAGEAADRNYASRRGALHESLTAAETLTQAAALLSALRSEYGQEEVPDLGVCEKWFSEMTQVHQAPVEIAEVTITGGGAVKVLSRRLVFPALSAVYAPTGGSNRDGDAFHDWFDYFVEPDGQIWVQSGLIGWVPRRRRGGSDPFFCIVTSDELGVERKLRQGNYEWRVTGGLSVSPSETDGDARARILGRAVTSAVRS